MTAKLNSGARTAKHYRQRAKDARERAAARSLDPTSAAFWLEIADSYDRLAAIAEEIALKRDGFSE
jgi:hypothetical protein